MKQKLLLLVTLLLEAVTSSWADEITITVRETIPSTFSSNSDATNTANVGPQV